MTAPAENTPLPAPIAGLQSLTEATKPPTGHGRNGKVARLPKAVRDQISTLIQDGVPYLKIIETLSLQTHGITENNLSTWKTGGYLEWLDETRILLALERKHELALSIVEKANQDTAGSQAVLQTVALNVCRFLAEMDPAELRQNLLSDSDKFTRFVNSMVRLAENGIKSQMLAFRAQDRAAEAAKHKNSAQRGGISDESLHTAEEKLKLM